MDPLGFSRRRRQATRPMPIPTTLIWATRLPKLWPGKRARRQLLRAVDHGSLLRCGEGRTPGPSTACSGLAQPAGVLRLPPGRSQAQHQRWPFPRRDSRVRFQAADRVSRTSRASTPATPSDAEGRSSGPGTTTARACRSVCAGTSIPASIHLAPLWIMDPAQHPGRIHRADDTLGR